MPQNEDMIGREEENYVRALMEKLRGSHAPGGSLQAQWVEGQLANDPSVGALYAGGAGMREDVKGLQQSMAAQAQARGASPLQARQASYQGAQTGVVGAGMAKGLDYMGQMAQVGLERDKMEEKIRAMQQLQESELEKQRIDEEAREKLREERRREEQSTYDRAGMFMGQGREGLQGILSDERMKTGIQFQSESPNEMDSIRSAMDEADLMRLQQTLAERYGY